MSEHTITLDKLENGFVINGHYGVDVTHRYAKTLKDAIEIITAFIGE